MAEQWPYWQLLSLEAVPRHYAGQVGLEFTVCPPFSAHTPFPVFVFWGPRLKSAAPCLAPRGCLDDSLLVLASLLISKQMQPLSATAPSSWWFQEIQERKESKLFDKMYFLDRIYPSLAKLNWRVIFVLMLCFFFFFCFVFGNNKLSTSKDQVSNRLGWWYWWGFDTTPVD